MIELIVGEKGKGKTKTMVAKASNDSRLTGINIIYIDSNNKHTDELGEHVHLLNLHDFKIRSEEMFLGFIYGIVSQNNNVDKIFMDNFLSIACINDDLKKLEELIEEINSISDKFSTDFVIGISLKPDDLPDKIKEYITIEL